jgi:hypothetical protein
VPQLRYYKRLVALNIKLQDVQSPVVVAKRSSDLFPALVIWRFATTYTPLSPAKGGIQADRQACSQMACFQTALITEETNTA